MKQTGGLRGPNGEITFHVLEAREGQSPVFTLVKDDEAQTPISPPILADELRHALHYHYDIQKPEGGWRPIESFTDAEKAKLRPIAETLAMLAGNAFFTMEGRAGAEWYEQYLPEAAALYASNGGDNGWAGEASFAKASR